MNYEPAKKLKDAGFPLKHVAIAHSDLPALGGYLKDGMNYYEWPTLSELIEACGDRFYELANLGRDSQDVAVWQSKDLEQKDGLWRMYRGCTPEEAVAELWLALNQK